MADVGVADLTSERTREVLGSVNIVSCFKVIDRNGDVSPLLTTVALMEVSGEVCHPLSFWSPLWATGPRCGAGEG